MKLNAGVGKGALGELCPLAEAPGRPEQVEIRLDLLCCAIQDTKERALLGYHGKVLDMESEALDSTWVLPLTSPL